MLHFYYGYLKKLVEYGLAKASLTLPEEKRMTRLKADLKVVPFLFFVFFSILAKCLKNKYAWCPYKVLLISIKQKIMVLLNPKTINKLTVTSEIFKSTLRKTNGL